MCTDVITHILRQQGAWVMNFLDDYIGVANEFKAESQFQSLGRSSRSSSQSNQDRTHKLCYNLFSHPN